VERFNRTLLEEWAYARPYTSNAERVAVGFVKRLGSTMVVDVAPARGQLCGLSVAGWASHLVYDLCCAVVALPVMTAEPARRGLLVRRLVIGAAALGLVVLLILLVVVL
jgi:hypothetical protein